MVQIIKEMGALIGTSIGNLTKGSEVQQLIRKLDHAQYPEARRAYRTRLEQYTLTKRQEKRVEGILKRSRGR